MKDKPYIKFYVAECEEFHNLGKYYDNLDLVSAVNLYKELRANTAKAIDKFNKMFETQEEKVKFTKAYKGNVCCINKRRGKCDFIGSIKDVSEYLVETTDYICDVINGVKEDKVYNIVPKIIGITHDEQGNYVGG